MGSMALQVMLFAYERHSQLAAPVASDPSPASF
eukprot:CAMPEP_0179432276 /NCGR_PEP_ID=MMETSP0799-20121207/16930_1 /TAXON_ID=46947 /ORGANISM="Geminigera cryophila, Strain CCMP2564" /LENGTH=32 /DNA_ID= /DNA_START= /DNA_END= /DNA_ORIENTATION=